MSPILFTIGKFNVYGFGFFLAVSFIFSTFVIWKYAKEEFKEDEYLDAYLYTSIIGLICARVFYIIFHFSDFGLNILRYIVVRETPGLSFEGGLIGTLIFLFLYSKRKKLNFYHLLDLFSVAGIVALVFVKIGEQLGGAGFGMETKSILGVRVIGLPGIRQPTELYEAVIYFTLSILLIILYNRSLKNKIPQNLVTCIFGMSVLLTSFALEFLKVREVYLYSLSLKQVFLLLGVLAILYPTVLKFIEVYKNYISSKNPMKGKEI